MPVTPPPDGRVLVAFDSNTLATAPVWTRLDSHPSLVTSYQIDRGRQFELDRTDAARAVIEIADRNGLLDPTNPTGPYYGKLEPLKQVMINRYNPVDSTWYTRFRGFIEEYDYSFDPSQRVNRLTLQLSDIFEIVSAVQFLPGQFGFPAPADNPEIGDQVFYWNQPVNWRIKHILADAFAEAYGYDWLPPGDPPSPPITTAFSVVFSGNVEVGSTTYGPGESLMTAIGEMADAEFPGVSNVYTDSRGRLVFHGRFAKFDPVTVAAGVSDDVWEYHQFQAGDLTAAQADPATARIRRFGFNRGMSKIINQVSAMPARKYDPSPLGSGDEITPVEAQAQVIEDDVSIGLYGIRSWSVENLQTRNGLSNGGSVRIGSLEEAYRFAQYYLENYRLPHNRVTDIGFRSIRPGTPGATETWRLLSQVDISDSVTVTIGSPGGGGFVDAPYFVEGVHETVTPLNPTYDNVEMTLDLSPQALFDYDPWTP